MNRVPIVPTIFVVAAAAVMVALGVWQLGRLDEKEALIARYQKASENAEPVEWPKPEAYGSALFKRSTVNCESVRAIDAVSGKSERGQSGWAHLARCDQPEGGVADVAIGWSRSPTSPAWEGGKVTGVIAPYGDVVKLVASEPVAGLEPLAKPDPSDLPNNHLAYAGQWFFFALTALLIYGFALRSRWRKRG